MIEGNRYEVLDVTTRESSRYIGMASDMPVQGYHRRDRPQRPGGLPARRRRARGGRPGDHLHRGNNARGSSRRCELTQAVARIGRPRRLAIDVAGVANLVGTLGKYLGLAALFPIPFALAYGEPFYPFVVAGVVTSGLGLALERATANASGRVGVREGFLVVALTWLLAAAFAAIPYLFEGGDQLSSPLDAYFEGMSGSRRRRERGHRLRRDQPLARHLAPVHQWLGGMGIIVLAIAVLPRLRVGGRQLMESELPGPEIAALGERIKSTARKLWLLYVALTAIQVLMLSSLWVFGIDELMTPYQALAHAFATMPTGGFSTQPTSAAAFSAAAQWILALFMAIAGANFALMYRAFTRRRPQVLARDEEFRLYVALLLLALRGGDGDGLGVRHRRGRGRGALGDVPGGVDHDDDRHGERELRAVAVAPAALALRLMFVGGSAGSTGGSIKVVRHLLLGKMLRREVGQTLSPEVMTPIRLNGTPVDERTIRAVAAFILLYVGFWAVGAAVIAIDSAIGGVGLGTLDALGASATTLGNVGPGSGSPGRTARSPSSATCRR